jgi:hypothetical protein
VWYVPSIKRQKDWIYIQTEENGGGGCGMVCPLCSVSNPQSNFHQPILAISKYINIKGIERTYVYHLTLYIVYGKYDTAAEAPWN